MLLLPGGFFDNRIWLYCDHLASKYNLYALNWPDDSPFYKENVADLADIAADFLGALSIKELYVAGISAGGLGAIELVANKKAFHYHALILISTHVMSITEKEAKSRTRRSRLVMRLSPDKLRAIIEDRVEKREFVPAPGPVQQKDIFWVRPNSYYHQLFSSAVNQGHKKPKVEEITCPVLCLHGSEDEIMDVETARLSAKSFSNATYLELEEQDHAMLFHHGPQVAKHILSFIEAGGLL